MLLSDIGRRNMFWGLFFINFAITLGFGIADAFFSVYLQSLAVHGMLFGLAIGSYALAKMLFSPLMGFWSDRVGKRKLVLASLFLYVAVSLFYITTSDPAAIILIRLLQGIGFAIFRPVVSSLVAYYAPAEKRASIMGTFDISFYSAIGLGPIVGGVIKDIFGYAGIFTVLAGLCLLALILAFKCIPAAEQTGQQGYDVVSIRNILSQWNNLKSNTIIIGLLAFIFGRTCSISMFIAFLPIMLISDIGLNGTQIGFVMASSTVTMTLLLRLIGKLSDKINKKCLIIFGGTGVALLYMLIPAANSLIQLLVVGSGIGFFSALSQPASCALLVKEGNAYGVGMTWGVTNTVVNLGFVVGPLMGTLIFSMVGAQGVLLFSGLCGLITVAIFVFCIMPAPVPCELHGPIRCASSRASEGSEA
jgi:MFS family permease